MPRLVQQLSDFVCYLLVPLLSLLLPARFSRSLIARVSRWDWLMGDYGRLIHGQAVNYAPTWEPRDWRARWRQVELLDTRDLWYLTFGRKRAVFRELEGADAIESARGRVLVGMHWGPAISILRLLADRGLRPAPIYLDEPLAMLFRRPFFWLFLRLSVREIRKAGGGREVCVGGSSGTLAERLTQDGTEVVLFDAPTEPGRSVMEGEVLGRLARFSAGFPKLLARSGKEYVFYAIGLAQDGSIRKRLEVSAPDRLDPEDPLRDEAAFLEAYSRYFSLHLERDSAQWRLWEAAPLIFGPLDEGHGEATEPATAA